MDHGETSLTVWKPAATFTGVIDVSHNNGPIKWSLVPPAILLVFIKASQGSGFVDPMFKQNFEGALDTGRLPVPYHFLDATDFNVQLANFRKAAGLIAGMPAALDWEIVPASNLRPPIQLMQQLGAALAKVINRSPLAYHGMYDLSNPVINAWPWWLPKYGPAPQGPKYLLWQDRPNLRVAGIPELTDHSVFSGTEAELRAWHKMGIMPAGF